MAACLASLAASAVASAACCIGSAACSMCCAACPNTTSSTATRTGYAVLFLSLTVVAWVMTNPSVGEALMVMDQYTGGVGIAPDECEDGGFGAAECAERWSQLGAYRVMFGGAIFYFFMAVLMFGVKARVGCRGDFQNGRWLLKVLLVIALIVAAFFIPNESFATHWSTFGLVGAAVFILVQSGWLVEFAHRWAEKGVENMYGLEKMLFVLVAIGSVVGVITLSAILLTYYGTNTQTGEQCSDNVGILGFNLFLAIFMWLASVLTNSPNRGLTQAGLVSFYCTYLCWSAVTESATVCHPDSAEVNDTVVTVFGLILTALSVMAFSSTSASDAGDPNDPYGMPASPEQSGTGQTVTENEAEGVKYNWSLFHFSLAVACLYVQNVLTNWGHLSTTEVSVAGNGTFLAAGDSPAPVWIQAVLSWLAAALYLWTLLAYSLGPRCCPNKDWSGDGAPAKPGAVRRQMSQV